MEYIYDFIDNSWDDSTWDGFYMLQYSISTPSRRKNVGTATENTVCFKKKIFIKSKMIND